MLLTFGDACNTVFRSLDLAHKRRLEEAVVDTIGRIVDKLEDRAQVEAETQAVADEQAARQDRSTMSYLNWCFASRNSPCGAEQWSQLQQFVSHQRSHNQRMAHSSSSHETAAKAT